MDDIDKPYTLDDDGFPIFKRPTITIPREVSHEFAQEMVEDCRQSAGELVVAILIKYYRMRRARVIARQEATEMPESVPVPVVRYGPKSLKSTVELKQQQSGDHIPE